MSNVSRAIGFSLALIYLSIINCSQAATPSSQEEAQALTILKKAEHARSPWGSMVLKATLNTTKGNNESTEIYRVYFKDDSKTLIGYLEPAFNRGDIALMIGESLWFYAKNTSRPTRITPIQRLSGSVSYGDITRLGWSDDYSIAEFGASNDDSSNQEPPKAIEKEKSPIGYHFVLTAKSPSATYQKVELFIDREYRAKMAEVYLLSGKHYKTLEFLDYELVDGEYVNTKIKFTDRMSKHSISVLEFSNISKKFDLPNQYFLKEGMPDFSKRSLQE
jgi:outer membrane lipoprotein-sorting protein